MDLLTITHSNKFTRLQTREYAYHPSIVNGIQRMMLNYLPGYVFDMYLDMNDYEFLATTLKIPRINVKHQKFTTLTCNTKFPIPMLSLHMSRQALNSEVFDADSAPADDGLGQGNLLHSNSLRKVYFALCAPASEESDPIARFSKPLINHKMAPINIYARDLEPFVFTRPSEQDPWTYNQTESDKLAARIDEVFVYNGKMALIEHNKHINTILKPIVVDGKDDPAASPCRSSYRWVMNPVFKDSHPIVNEDFTLRRKIEGQPGPKDMFLMAPTQDEAGVYGKMDYQNKFGKPYGLDLMFQYNGKVSPLNAMKRATATFIRNLEIMQSELGHESDVIHKEFSNEGQTTKLTIPLNVDVNLAKIEEGRFQVLLDDGIHHAVSVKVLELLDNIIGSRIELWENTAVYYKVPHRLVSQIILFVKLPESQEFEQEVRDSLTGLTAGVSTSLALIQKAINEVIVDLRSIQAAL